MSPESQPSPDRLKITELNVYPVKSLGAVSMDRALVTEKGLAFDRNWMVVTEDGNFVTQRQIPAMATVAVEIYDEHLVLSHADVDSQLILPTQERPNLDVRDVVIHGSSARGLDEGEKAADWLTEVLGQYKDKGLRLVRFPADFLREVDPEKIGEGRAHTGFADQYPLLVISEESLAELNRRLEENGSSPVPMDRFRPNIVVSGGDAFVEDRIAALQAGDVEIELLNDCKRCGITTVDQERGIQPEPGEPLRTLGQFRRKSGGGVYFGQNGIVSKGAMRLLKLGDYFDITPANQD